MTYTELATIHLTRNKKYIEISDFILLFNLANVAKNKKYKSKSDFNFSNRLKMNLSKANKKNKTIESFILDSYVRFKDLNELELYSKYVIWWVYTIFESQLLKKYTSIDFMNDNLMRKYLDWSNLFVKNIEIINSFNKSAKKLVRECIKSNMDIETMLEYLVISDKLSIMYTTGDISQHAIASLIDNSNIKQIINNSQRSLFTKQLFEAIIHNYEYLISSLNNACRNLIPVPVNFKEYCEILLKNLKEKMYNSSQ